MELKIVVRLLMLILSAFSVFIIFDGRVLLSKRVDIYNINKVVKVLRVLGFILLVSSLYIMYIYV